MALKVSEGGVSVIPLSTVNNVQFGSKNTSAGFSPVHDLLGNTSF